MCQKTEGKAQKDSPVDPLKRFEYLRNGKATSVMIRATPNAVRWDEINRVQYRFQALNFHSDVLEALIHNSPPLSRREHKIATKPTDDDKESKENKDASDDNNNTIEQEQQNGNPSSDCDLGHTKIDDKLIYIKKDKQTQRIVTCLHRSNSFESVKRDMDDNYSKRKGSVVQLTKDDTSDYNSDEEVFPNRSESDSFDSVSYNATICHVTTGQIRDTARIQVTSYNEDSDTDDGNNNSHCSKEPINDKLSINTQKYKNNLNKINLPRLTFEETCTEKDSEGVCNKRNFSSAPPSTKVSVAAAIDRLPIKDRFQSETLHRDLDIDGEDLSSKTKEELVDLVKRLKRELETTKHYTLQKSHSPPTRYRSRSSAHPTCLSASGETSQKRSNTSPDSINEEEFVEHSPMVHRLIKNFEEKKKDCAE